MTLHRLLSIGWSCPAFLSIPGPLGTLILFHFSPSPGLYSPT